MKLLLNTTLLKPPLTGIGNYTLNLLQQFQTMSDFAQISCFNETQVFSGHQALLNYDRSTAVTKTTATAKKEQLRRLISRLPYAYRIKDQYINYQLSKRQLAVQDHLYHEPNFILQKHKGPAVITIHDLSMLHHPSYHPKARVQWFNQGMAATLKRANHVLTVSHLVRAEIIEHFNLNPDRVHTTYLAADTQFQPRSAKQTQAVLDQYGLTHGQYLLFVGTIEPRKGVIDLLNAWEQLPHALRQAYPLVLAGGAGWRHSEIMQRMQQLSAKGEVKYLDYVPNADLPLLYSGCLSFVFPSVYEGFGLPVLEAMASGVPVLCRQGTSMAEFAQGAVLLHENSTESLNHELARLIDCAELRQSYAAQGLARAAEFSWQACASQTLGVYRRC